MLFDSHTRAPYEGAQFWSFPNIDGAASHLAALFTYVDLSEDGGSEADAMALDLMYNSFECAGMRAGEPRSAVPPAGVEQ